MIMTSVQTNRAAMATTENNTREVIDYIENLEAEVSDLESEINATREQIKALESSQAEEQTQLALLNDLAEQLSISAQLTDLAGSGIVITLDDNAVGAALAQKNNPATYMAENYIVHDKDLLYLLRALSHATEACAVNGLRLTDASSIRCAGTIILINSTRLAPPYKIEIIGDQEELVAALTSCGTYLSLIYRGIPLEYAKQDQLLIKTYTGAYSTSYSQAAADQLGITAPEDLLPPANE